MSILTLAATLLLLGPVNLESGRFTITQDGKKIGSEQFTISAGHDGGYVAEAKTQLTGDPLQLSSRLELDQKLNPVSYEYTHGKGTIRVKFGAPTSDYETETDGKKSSMEFRFPESGFILDNNFFSHYVMLLYKVSEAGGTMPILVPQDMQLGVATIKSKGSNVYELHMGEVVIEATTDKSGKLIRLAVPSAKVVVER
jgi:hypothetical protein